ncbi:MAG: hypothetical protein V7655_09860 [Aequorivita antarctica]
MAPYKLEDNIREKLEMRELNPSTEAWEKLEAKLDAQQPKKKTVLWYYVAASFVGFLILASVFFSNNNTEVNHKIVDETIVPNSAESQPEIIPNNIEVEEIASEENSSEKVEAIKSNSEDKQKQNSKILKPLSQKKSEIDKKVDNTDVIAKVTYKEEKQPLNATTQKPKGENKLFNQKIDEVVASVKKLQEKNNEVNATDIDALLNNARSDIQTQQILNSPKVDATALLEDVEWEVEKSFRDKVFDALGDGFQKVRTAVSERND